MSPKRTLAALATVLFLASGIAARADLGFSETKLRGHEQIPTAYLGSAIALSGDTVLVGAWGEAHVFVREAGAWVHQARLTGDHGRDSHFGTSVALSGDTAVIGAYREGVGTAAGAVYVFSRHEGVWSREAKLTSRTSETLELFGSSVAIAGDTLLVGVVGGDGAVSDSGTAEVFVRNAGTWTLQAQLSAPDGAQGDGFGQDVALSGNRALVGALRHDPRGIANAGAAYVFARDGGEWHLEAQLTAADAAPTDRFGFAVALDGSTAVVGAWFADFAAGRLDAGATYVFTREGGAWTRQAKLVAPDPEPDDRFGHDVAVSGDRVAVGAWLEDARGDASGSVYLFRRQQETWTLQGKLVASDTVAQDRFGHALAFQGDVLVAGAYGNSDEQFDSGSAYVFGLPLLRVVALPAQQTVPPGGVAPVTILVRNLGGSRLRNVTVSVPAAPLCNAFLGTLFPGQRKRFVCPVAVGSESFTLTVFATATPVEGPPVTATTEATVSVE
jgi:hypothetical protein